MPSRTTWARLAAAAMLVMLATGCAGAKEDPSMLEGREWKAVEVREAGGGLVPVPADVTVSARFAEARVSGSGGVNSYGGAYTVSGSNQIAIGPVNATLMAGPEPAMSVESAYFAALETATRYRVTADTLELLDESATVYVRFE